MTVWYSNAQVTTPQTFFVRPVTADLPSVIEAYRQMRLFGTCPPAETMPRCFVGGYGDVVLTPPERGLFMLAGFLAVTHSCAAAIRRSNLGDGRLHEVEVFQSDEKSRLPGQYYLLLIGEQKTGFVPKRSKAKRDMFNPQRWKIAANPKNGSITVDQSVRLGADIWIDPALTSGFFVGERLYKCLAAAGVEDAFRFVSCRVTTD